MPSCPNHGEHKAPKHRGLNEYYYFCTEHIKEYNKAWDFFSGMSRREVEEHVMSSIYGDRPTWRYDSNGTAEEHLYETAQKTYCYGDTENNSTHRTYHNNSEANFLNEGNTPEHEALALMGLNPPITLDDVKTRYKNLAKKHHPDLNRNDPDSEELLKKINMSYTILKLAFKEYSKLKERNL
ncbi:MAG: J domain-containing protein [Alphaproteobacteria bacterium]|nr:J domain-containing protein [Alphaproteobacteria bacterium]